MIYWIDEARDGFENMAIDESMAQVAVERNSAILRIYQWNRAFLTLGYFQSAKDIQSITELQELPFARRLSGGGAIVHHHELTYCLTAPDNTGSKSAAGEMYCLVHNTIAYFFAQHGCTLTSSSCQITGDAGDASDNSTHAEPFLCFERRSSADLLLGSHKIVGSAQRRLGRAILQHGSILLSHSTYTPQLAGITDLIESNESLQVLQSKDISGSLAEAVSSQYVEHFCKSGAFFSPADLGIINEIVGRSNIAEARFRSTEWNHRR